MTNEEAIKELTKFVKLKTTLEPSFLSVAISALEKQIAKKPTEDEYGHKCCPLCSWTVDEFWNYDRIKLRIASIVVRQSIGVNPMARKMRFLNGHTNRNTLCWCCSKATGGCNWSNWLKPVEGWKIESTKMDYSQRVIECPEFERDSVELNKRDHGWAENGRKKSRYTEEGCIRLLGAFLKSYVDDYLESEDERIKRDCIQQLEMLGAKSVINEMLRIEKQKEAALFDEE